tara:strand:+ start:395 stop:571 length:177 start_codon:yes stop_codon:yes gene_type:complete
MRNKMSHKFTQNLKKDWYQHLEVKRVKVTKDAEKTIVNEVEQECVAVMRANGGAPHYM